MRHYTLTFDDIPYSERKARGYWRPEWFTIEHSGCRFTSNVMADVPGWGAVYVWPIAELLARTNFPPAQAQRIRKLNPYGKPEAAMCVGWWRN